MNNKVMNLKPLGEIHLYFLVVGFIIFVPFDIVMLTPPFEKILLLTVIVYNICIFTAWICVRLFLRQKYVIDEVYVKRYKGKNVVFKIKQSDVLKIYIKKAPWYDFFAFLLDVLSGGLRYTQGTNISFVFKECDIMETVESEIKRKQLKNKYEDKELTEFSDIMSIRQCKKLCKRLKIAPIII